MFEIKPIVEPQEDSKRKPSIVPACLKKFFDDITVEPVAFLAIYALYIEFPMIQDLFYTKACLQVTSKSRLEAIGSYALTIQDLRELASRTHLNYTSNYQADSNQSSLFSSSSSKAVDYVICDKLNRTSLPPYTQKEIYRSNALIWFKYEMIICALCAISSLYWGGISDTIGRLIPLNVPIFTSLLSNLISLLAGLNLYWFSDFPVSWLYLGAALIGLSGGQSVVIMSSFGFISDTSSHQSRFFRMVVLESIIFIARSAGFSTAKLILLLTSAPEQHWFNRHFTAFFLCILINFICISYYLLKLRHNSYESNLRRPSKKMAGQHLPSSSSATINQLSAVRDVLTDSPIELSTLVAISDNAGNLELNSKTNWTNLVLVNQFKETFETATKARHSRPVILLLLASGFISTMTLASQTSLLYIYLRMAPFNWATSRYSSWNSMASITQGLALVMLTCSAKFMKDRCVPDPLVAAIGYLSKGIGLLMLALAQTSAVIDWALLALILSEYSMPPIRSLLSKQVARDEVGKIYSCLGSMQSICFMFGNLIFYLVNGSIATDDFFRLSFMVVACSQFVAVLIMILVYIMLNRNSITIWTTAN